MYKMYVKERDRSQMVSLDGVSLLFNSLATVI